MTLIAEILAGLEQIDPAKAEALKAELAQAGAPQGPPPRPATILDEVRTVGLDALGLAVDEIPATHELPQLVGRLVQKFRELEADVKALADERSSGGSAAEPAPVESTEPTAPAVPAPADTTPPTETASVPPATAPGWPAQ